MWIKSLITAHEELFSVNFKLTWNLFLCLFVFFVIVSSYNLNIVRLRKWQAWYIKSSIYLLGMGFIIQPTTGGLLWCALNIWVALPIKASAFFLCLIYCHSSSAQTSSWNLCQSSNGTVLVLWLIFLSFAHLPSFNCFALLSTASNFT